MRNQGTQFDKTTTYTYDARGNITSVTANGSTTTYTYDNLGQLTRENNQAAGKTWTWTYDTAGNILSKSEYAYTTGSLGTALDTITYGYADSRGWGDLLTSYDGRSFQYDEIGNLLSDGEWTYTWSKGRQLVSMSKPGSTLTFIYDADGNRITKTVNSTTTTYTYVDGRVTHETNGTDTIHYRYDTNGTLLSMNLNGTEYYYLYNGQRDVIGLYDANGNVVVEYTYDAWGKPLTTTGSLASTVGAKNPYRYRGYRYDMENERYCLRNRLYDPVLIRFTSSDQYVCTGIGIVGANMFAYCNNNPVNCMDQNGMWTISISRGVSGLMLLGASASIGVAIDDNLNFEIQFSYALPTVDDTGIVGLFTCGIDDYFQYTKADTVYDLHGLAEYVGASGGGVWWHVGADAIAFPKTGEDAETIDGFQVYKGIGVGVDVHIADIKTIPVFPSAEHNKHSVSSKPSIINKTQIKKKTGKTKTYSRYRNMEATK